MSSISFTRAQSLADPSGHWEGAVPGMARFEIDLARNAAGEFIGTISLPDEHLKGLPLLSVSVDGIAVSFSARGDQPFQGALADGGKSMTGELIVEGFSLPLMLTRTGDARLEPPQTSPAIGRELEASWNGTLEAEGRPYRLVLKLSNQPDGTSTGAIVNLDQGGLTLPITIAQRGRAVTLNVSVIGASYSGLLNAEATELAGTFTQGARTAPLTFTRAARAGVNK
jgi:hypothetical protein